jgi:peptidoglycan L-alanyl-D-glutamate endopeptidase CwlK
MKYKLSIRSRERLEGVHPSLISLIEYALIDSPFDFGIPRDGGARTQERQNELYAIGRTKDLHKAKVTWTRNSKHLVKSDGYGHAFDLYAYVDGKASWKSKYIDAIGKHILKCADELEIKIQWGVTVNGKHTDKGHFQLV